MSEDILNRIDDTLGAATRCFCGCQGTLKASGASPWFASEDCQVRWNVRRLTTKNGIEKEAVPVGAVVARHVCRGCRQVSVRPAAAKLCPECEAGPKCSAERSTAEWGGAVVCFRPTGHDGVHESVEGRAWSEPPPSPVEAIRLVRRTPEQRIAYLAQKVTEAIDAGSSPDFIDALRQVLALAQVERLDGLSLECGMANPLCSGCDGLARGAGRRPCQHDCHATPVTWLPIPDTGPLVGFAGQPEPVPPLVDAAVEPSPDVTLMPADQFDNLVATLDEPDEVPALRRAFWRRWFR